MKLTLARGITHDIITDTTLSELELNIVIMMITVRKPMLVLDVINEVRQTNRPYKFVLDKFYCAAIANLCKRKVLVYA